MARNINKEVLSMLPEDAIEYFFLSHNLATTAAGDSAPLTSALEDYRMAATNLPVNTERLAAARTALDAALKAAQLLDAVGAKWAGRKEEAASAEKARAAAAGKPAGLWNKPVYTNKVMQEVQPGLFVGSYHPAADAAYLKQHGVTHVCCCIDVKARFPSEFQYITLPAADANGYNIAQHFDETYEFIAKALATGGVLVHCGAGISRAPTIAAAFLIRRLGVTAHVAVAMIRKVRECASPNAGFFSQLQVFEKKWVRRAPVAADKPDGGPSLASPSVAPVAAV